ncbi:MAG: biopolymer transporter ExbD [Elusimicrobiota bacterium]
MTGINVTPLVDVCLVLVIIFMVTTPLLSQPAFDVDLPEATTKEGQEEEKTTISISRDGSMAVDARTYKTLRSMKEPLKYAIAQTEEGLVVIRADKEALHGVLTEVMALAKVSGAKSIRIATERKN